LFDFVAALRARNLAEREIAWVSFPNLPQHQAKLEYLKNLQRMRAMQADGRLPPQGR
jgi:hypothetical protein